jgi:hypothetical protein
MAGMRQAVGAKTFWKNLAGQCHGLKHSPKTRLNTMHSFINATPGAG